MELQTERSSVKKATPLDSDVPAAPTIDDFYIDNWIEDAAAALLQAYHM